MPDKTRPDRFALVEQQLAELKPVAPTIDRDQLMYNAGWAAADAAAARRSSPRLWKMATLVSTAAALLLVAHLVALPGPSGEAPPTVVSISDTVISDKRVATLTEPRSNWNYLVLRESVLTNGIEAWKNSQATDGESFPTTPITNRSLMRQLLGDSDVPAKQVLENDDTEQSSITNNRRVV